MKFGIFVFEIQKSRRKTSHLSQYFPIMLNMEKQVWYWFSSFSLFLLLFFPIFPTMFVEYIGFYFKTIFILFFFLERKLRKIVDFIKLPLLQHWLLTQRGPLVCSHLWWWWWYTVFLLNVPLFRLNYVCWVLNKMPKPNTQYQVLNYFCFFSSFFFYSFTSKRGKKSSVSISEKENSKFTYFREIFFDFLPN